jgi:uncharacterized damage-inducible protein DinB
VGDSKTTRDVLAARWAELGDKLVTLAAEFPAGRYEERPAEGVRSFGDQLRHVAFWNDYVAKVLRGEEADGAANELPRSRHPSRQAVVAALRESFDAVGREIAAGNGTIGAADVDSMVSFIEHGGEHYGQLVVYYRLAGLVPPASR